MKKIHDTIASQMLIRVTNNVTITNCYTSTHDISSNIQKPWNAFLICTYNHATKKESIFSCLQLIFSRNLVHIPQKFSQNPEHNRHKVCPNIQTDSRDKEPLDRRQVCSYWVVCKIGEISND